MVRSALAALIVLGLAVAIWWLWPGQVATTPSTTLPQAIESTTTEATVTTTPSTTTSDGEAHVVETVEEAEMILRELWFGWFEGIYNQDEDRIREVVATEELLNAGIDAFGSEFESPPSLDGIEVIDPRILRSDDHCLAVWSTLDVSDFRGVGARTDSVIVMRYVSDSWRIASSWVHQDDLWEADCDAQLLPLS